MAPADAMISPSPLQLRHPSGATAEVLVHHGAILNRLHLVQGGKPLSLVEPNDTGALPVEWGQLRGVPVMFPFPGRVKDARYQALGRTYTGLPVNDTELPGNHLHGLVATLPWRLLAHSSSTCTSEITDLDLPQTSRDAYPFPFRLRLSHRLAADSLRFELTVENPGATPLPFGLGLHPYLSCPFGQNSSRDDCTLELPAGHHWPQQDFMPVGRLEPVPPQLDLRAPRRIGELFGEPPNAVYSLHGAPQDQPAASLRDPFTETRLDMYLRGVWQALVLFRPPEGPSICVEPQTCLPNAVNLRSAEADTGWLELPPGEAWSGAVELRLSHSDK